MAYRVQTCTVTRQPLAAARARTTQRELGNTIRELLTESAVYAYLERVGVRQHGHNVIVYWDEDEKALLGTDEGLVIEVGVQVSRPFESEGRVTCSATPGGTAATAVHIGPYHQLGKAHEAIRDWCRRNHRPIAGPNWEVYGDWNDDPSQLRTDVFYLLK